jgi:hypothetical protein
MLRAVLIFALSATSLLAEQPSLQSAKNWEVRGAQDRITWVELHEIDPADPSVIHGEILSRKKGDDPSDVHHVRAHLAITLEALQRSVVRPLRDKRGVYPESFDYGYKAWRESANHDVCRTTVSECVDTTAN